jgi:hypothetical protein
MREIRISVAKDTSLWQEERVSDKQSKTNSLSSSEEATKDINTFLNN